MAYATVSFTISGKEEDIDKTIDYFLDTEKRLEKRKNKVVAISHSIDTEYAKEDPCG